MLWSPMIQKLNEFCSALWSFVRYGDAPIPQATERELICGGCPEQVISATGLHCAACGCPRSSLSDLRTKWRMRDIACPLGRW